MAPYSSTVDVEQTEEEEIASLEHETLTPAKKKRKVVKNPQVFC